MNPEIGGAVAGALIAVVNIVVGFSCGRTYERRMQLRNHPGATLTVTVPLTESSVDRTIDVEKGIKTTRVEAVGKQVEEWPTPFRPMEDGE